MNINYWKLNYTIQKIYYNRHKERKYIKHNIDGIFSVGFKISLYIYIYRYFYKFIRPFFLYVIFPINIIYVISIVIINKELHSTNKSYRSEKKQQTNYHISIDYEKPNYVIQKINDNRHKEKTCIKNNRRSTLTKTYSEHTQASRIDLNMPLT